MLQQLIHLLAATGARLCCALSRKKFIKLLVALCFVILSVCAKNDEEDRHDDEKQSCKLNEQLLFLLLSSLTGCAQRASHSAQPLIPVVPVVTWNRTRELLLLICAPFNPQLSLSRTGKCAGKSAARVARKRFLLTWLTFCLLASFGRLIKMRSWRSPQPHSMSEVCLEV